MLLLHHIPHKILIFVHAKSVVLNCVWNKIIHFFLTLKNANSCTISILKCNLPNNYGTSWYSSHITTLCLSRSHSVTQRSILSESLCPSFNGHTLTLWFLILDLLQNNLPWFFFHRTHLISNHRFPTCVWQFTFYHLLYFYFQTGHGSIIHRWPYTSNTSHYQVLMFSLGTRQQKYKIESNLRKIMSV